MDVQEAVNIIQRVRRIAVLKPDNPELEAFDMAIEALRKQEPQRVSHYQCPRCKRAVFKEVLKSSYCEACGQLLSWKEF